MTRIRPAYLKITAFTEYIRIPRKEERYLRKSKEKKPYGKGVPRGRVVRYDGIAWTIAEMDLGPTASVLSYASLCCHTVPESSSLTVRGPRLLNFLRARSVFTYSTPGMDPARNTTVFYTAMHRRDTFQPGMAPTERALMILHGTFTESHRSYNIWSSQKTNG